MEACIAGQAGTASCAASAACNGMAVCGYSDRQTESQRFTRHAEMHRHSPLASACHLWVPVAQGETWRQTAVQQIRSSDRCARTM